MHHVTSFGCMSHPDCYNMAPARGCTLFFFDTGGAFLDKTWASRQGSKAQTHEPLFNRFNHWAKDRSWEIVGLATWSLLVGPIVNFDYFVIMCSLLFFERIDWIRQVKLHCWRFGGAAFIIVQYCFKCEKQNTHVLKESPNQVVEDV